MSWYLDVAYNGIHSSIVPLSTQIKFHKRSALPTFTWAPGSSLPFLVSATHLSLVYETDAFFIPPPLNSHLHKTTHPLNSPPPRSSSHPPCVITSISPFQYLTAPLSAGGLLFKPCKNFFAHCFSKLSFILLSASHVADNNPCVMDWPCFHYQRPYSLSPLPAGRKFKARGRSGAAMILLITR